MEQEQERIYAEREIVHRKKSFDEVRVHINQRDLTKVELESIKIILNKEIFEPYVETEIIELDYLDDEDWDKAFELQQKLNISAADAIHLAVARIMGCDIFVTKDSYLRKIASAFFKPSKLLFSGSSDIDEKIECWNRLRKKEHSRKN
jgi:predicted nucleic acid-binding protein